MTTPQYATGSIEEPTVPTPPITPVVQATSSKFSVGKIIAAVGATLALVVSGLFVGRAVSKKR